MPWFPPEPAAEPAKPASLIAFAVEAEEEEEKRGQRDEEENRSDNEASNDRIGERRRRHRRRRTHLREFGARSVRARGEWQHFGWSVKHELEGNKGPQNSDLRSSS